MKAKEKGLSDWGILWMVSPLPALVGVTLAIVVTSTPIATLVAIVGTGYLVMLVGIIGTRMAERRPEVFEVEQKLELVDTVPLEVAPATIGVARTTGSCPMGYQPGCMWVVDRGGHLYPQICRPAVEALASTSREPDGHREGARKLFSCQCPLKGGEVVFTLREGAVSGAL